MQILRRGRKLTICTRLLAAAIVLRSFIAPGFMLSVSTDGFDMVFCNGPAGIHAPDNGPSGHHHHHGDNGETRQQVHVTPMCAHWSSSSLFVSNAFYAPALDVVPLPVKTNAAYQSVPLREFLDSPRVTRGPPSPV